MTAISSKCAWLSTRTEQSASSWDRFDEEYAFHMRKRCILLEECEFGAEVLWYEPWDSGKPEDEQHYMRIFRHETGDHYIAMVQPHMVVPIPDEVKSEWKWGRWFPEQSWLDTVIPQWREPYQ